MEALQARIGSALRVAMADRVTDAAALCQAWSIIENGSSFTEVSMSDRNAVLDEGADAVEGVEPTDPRETMRWNREDWSAALARAIEHIGVLRVNDDT